VNSEDEIVGYASDLGMSFSAVSEEDMTKINLQFNGKAISVQIGSGEREGEIYIEGYSIDSGAVATLTTDDFNALETLMLEIAINDNDLRKMFVRTLNLLYSWPPKLSLFVLMDESVVIVWIGGFLPLIFNRSVLDFPPFVIDICDDYGKPHDGWYFNYFLIFPIKVNEVTKTVGGEECIGRCGGECMGDTLVENWLNLYTQDCFNHDVCCDEQGLLHWDCDMIFILCIDDFVSVLDNCLKAYDTTTTSSSTTTTTSVTSTTSPSSSTTTTAICLSEEIYGEGSEEVELLRYVRDNVLSQTPEGQELIRLYYQWSPVIVKAMEEDEEFRDNVQDMIDGVLGLVGEETE
jgi:hypothetical protein